MSSFKEYLFELSSGVKDEIEELKNDDSEWGKKLKDWIFGKDSPFDQVGTHRNWMTSVSKPVPKEVKLKYPDIVFALQALALHMGMERYFGEWEKAKQYLKFDPKYKKQKLYRFWEVTEDEIKKLQDGKSIPKKAGNQFSSYTRNNKLFRFDTKLRATILNVSTEYLQQTSGRGTVLITQHEIVPVFDIFYFLVHLINRFKIVFKSDRDTLKGIPDNYMHEREVIGPAVTEIRPEDVVGFYKDAQFTKLDEKPIDVLGYKLSVESIKNLKASYDKYGNIDMSMFGNSLIIYSNPEKSNLKRYINTDKPEIHKKLSDALGVTVYVGRWK